MVVSKGKYQLSEIRMTCGLTQQNLVDLVNKNYYDVFQKNILSLSTLKDVESDKTRINLRAAHAIIAIINKLREKEKLDKISIYDIKWRVQSLSPLSQEKYEAIQKMRNANPKVRKAIKKERNK